MVALTIILASLIGTVILGFVADVAQDDPVVSFQMSQDETAVVLAHTGGDTLDGNNTYVHSESGGWLGNLAGTDGQACETTIQTVQPGTECELSDAPSGELSIIWRSDSRSAILYRGHIFSGESPTPPTAAESIEAVQSEGVDAQSSQVEVVIENTGEDTVTIEDFAVDATAISTDVWIDDGNNPEFETSGATDDGSANDEARKSDSFLADGTSYRLEDNNGESAELSATDDSVTITVRAFGPDDEWIDDSDELELVNNESDADVIVSLGVSDGSVAELYLRVV